MLNSASELGSTIGSSLGALFSDWLFGSDSSDADDAAQRQQQLQKQQMMDELRRRQEEAERQHQAEEAQRLAEMYNRLMGTLKLRGLPNLQLKTSGLGDGSTLRLKLGDEARASTIPGSPGSNVTFDQHLSDLSSTTGLQLKLGDSARASGNPNLPSAGNPAAPDFNKMTPQQLADLAESFSKLPPEEQQRLMASAQAPAQQQPQVMRDFQQTLDGKSDLTRLDSSSAMPNVGNQNSGATPLTGNSSGIAQPSGQAQSTAVAPPTGGNTQSFMPPGEIRDAPSPKATTEPNVDFDRRNSGQAPDGPAVDGLKFKLLGSGASAPAAPTATSQALAPKPSPPSGTGGRPVPVAGDIQLFPEEPSKWPGPKDPNFPLLNPLREEATFQQEMKQWDDWATKTGLDRIRDRNQVRESGTPAYMANFLRENDGELVQRYAPELYDRYERDTNFRAEVDLRMKYANENTTMIYYQEIADAHKAGIQAYRDGIEKLENDGVLEKGMGLADQEQRHPELIPGVQAVAAAAGAKEDAELSKVRANLPNIDNEQYGPLFDFLKKQVASESK